MWRLLSGHEIESVISVCNVHMKHHTLSGWLTQPHYVHHISQINSLQQLLHHRSSANQIYCTVGYTPFYFCSFCNLTDNRLLIHSGQDCFTTLFSVTLFSNSNCLSVIWWCDSSNMPFDSIFIFLVIVAVWGHCLLSGQEHRLHHAEMLQKLDDGGCFDMSHFTLCFQ